MGLILNTSPLLFMVLFFLWPIYCKLYSIPSTVPCFSINKENEGSLYVQVPNGRGKKLIPALSHISQVINSLQTGTKPGQASGSRGKRGSSHSSLQTSMWPGIPGVQTTHCPRRLIQSREQRGQTSCYGPVQDLL